MIEWKDQQGNFTSHPGVPIEEVKKLNALKFETPEGIHFGVSMSTVINIYGNTFVSAPRSGYDGVVRLYYRHINTEFVFGCPGDIVVELGSRNVPVQEIQVCSSFETILTGIIIFDSNWFPGWLKK